MCRGGRSWHTEQIPRTLRSLYAFRRGGMERAASLGLPYGALSWQPLFGGVHARLGLHELLGSILRHKRCSRYRVGRGMLERQPTASRVRSTPCCTRQLDEVYWD